MGFKVFRLSIAWSRIYPNGDELQPNRAGLEFYHDVFHTCHAYGIEPLVTICHYDMPHALSVKWNGWADRRCIELFERYCRTLFAEYGHEVKYWLTFNEMNILTAPMCGYLCAGIQPLVQRDIRSWSNRPARNAGAEKPAVSGTTPPVCGKCKSSGSGT